MYKGIRREISKVKFRGDWIFSRTACLGNDAYQISQSREVKRWNVQKGRADVLVSQLRGKSRGTTPPPPFLFKEEDNWRISCQVALNHCLHFNPPRYILMDSFSELTDQLFKYKGNEFLAHYRDSNWATGESNNVESLGLLPPESIHNSYVELFYEIQSLWGDIPVYFIMFPTKFDERKEFQIRGEIIANSLALMEKSNENMKVINIPDVQIKLHEAELGKDLPFPYHFAPATLAFVSTEIDKYENKN